MSDDHTDQGFGKLAGDNAELTRPGGSRVPPEQQAEHPDETVDELERQARETLRIIRETAGDLGSRVREVLNRASATWDETQVRPLGASGVPKEQEGRARRLARRWAEIDFLVDPELPDAMTVTAFDEAAVWKVTLRERGETRSLSEGTEPYRGATPTPLGPVLPLWEYAFPLSPEIEAGERHERLPGSDVVGACLRCNGTGHKACAACEGRGFVQCSVCHGRARIPCRRCRGRGRIADAAAERRARASKGYLQVQAERLAVDAGERLADFAERLRQDYGVPLPPSAQWAPQAPASGETIPCPDCVNGSIPCDCGNGKRVCEHCHGTGAATCSACTGTGRTLRFREVVRRFDTRISERTVPNADGPAPWITEEMVRRATGVQVWEGPLDMLGERAPDGVPQPVWAAALAFANGSGRALETSATESETRDENARHVISRRVRLLRVPFSRIGYRAGDADFSVVAAGTTGTERFWAETFPARWTRVSRFFKALTRDLVADSPSGRSSVQPPVFKGVSSLDEFRARREQIVRVELEPVSDQPTTRIDEPVERVVQTPDDSTDSSEE